MIDDLKIIKKEYGEKMAHLCRELFPIILETKGLLSKIVTSKFARNHFLYDDLKDNNIIEEFKNYIYSLVDVEHKEEKQINKSVKELMSDAGYDFYECQTEEDIQSFRKYYATGEELCTFTNGNRLERCYVFFAVKKTVDEIKRENFQNPERQDEYGTSVISIQFTRKVHTLSIKNRYNHRVNNPDATFSNNLENIIPGLTQAFEQEYNLKINQNESSEFELEGYILANDGKFYKYNYEINNIYYCPNNIIIDHGEVKEFDTSRYLLIDYFVIDFQKKTISIHDKYVYDGFINDFLEIIKIKITKKNEGKIITICVKNGEDVIIEIDKFNNIIKYTNSNIKTIKEDFLYRNETLKEIYLKNVEQIGSYFLFGNVELMEIYVPKLKIIGSNCLTYNRSLKKISLPNLEKVGSKFLNWNNALEEIYVPSLKMTDFGFLSNSENLEKIELPNLIECPDDFLCFNKKLKEIYIPNVIKIGKNFLMQNKFLKTISIPKVTQIGYGFLLNDQNLEKIIVPKVIKIGDRFLSNNQILEKIELPNLKECGKFFLYFDFNLKEIYAPNLVYIDEGFLKNDLDSNLRKMIISDNLETLDTTGRIKALRKIIKLNEFKDKIKKIGGKK